MTDDTPRPLPALLGLLLVRVVVPAWILTGATFKLFAANPALLPRNILVFGHQAGVDLDLLLAVLISLEFLAASVMIFIARLARITGFFMLGVFCLILVGEIVSGNTSCGCLGANSPSPWTMLAIDGVMLAGLVALRPSRSSRPPAAWPWLAAAILTIVAAVATFAHIVPGFAPATPRADAATADPDPDAVAPTLSVAPALPATWFETDFAAWIGRPWSEIDLLRWVDPPLDGLDDDTRAVVFYRRSCDHCEVMFRDDLAPHPDRAARVIAVEIPETATKRTTPGAWPMPETACDLRQLPLGPNWIIQSPLAVRIENGTIACAEEGSHADCLEIADDGS